MKNCQACNHSCEDFMAFCPNCGTKIEQATVETSTVSEETNAATAETVSQEDTSAQTDEIKAETVSQEDTSVQTDEIKVKAEQISKAAEAPDELIEEVVQSTENLVFSELASAIKAEDSKPDVANQSTEPAQPAQQAQHAQPAVEKPKSGVRIDPPVQGGMPRDNSVPNNMPPQNTPKMPYPAQQNGPYYCPDPQNPNAQNNNWNRQAPPPQQYNQPNNGAPNAWNNPTGMPNGMPPQQYQNQQNSQSNVFGVIGTVLGILGIIMCITIIFPVIFGIGAIILGIIHVVKNQKKALGIVAIASGAASIIIAIVVAFFGLFIFSTAIDKNPSIIDEFTQEFGREFSNKFEREFRNFDKSDKYSYYLEDNGYTDNHHHCY